MAKKRHQQWSSSRSATVSFLLFAAAAANGANEHEGLGPSSDRKVLDQRRTSTATDTTEHEYLYDCPDTAPQKSRNDDVPDVSADFVSISLLLMSMGGVGGIVF